MLTLRFETSGTHTNFTALWDLLKSPSLKRLTLFASPVSAPDSDRVDEGNLPLLSALAETTIPGLGAAYIVYDGTFLTAQRSQRASEIGALLDIAVNDNRVFYGTERAPFTAKMEAVDAARLLCDIDAEALTAETLHVYWAMLSNLHYGYWKE